MRITEKDQLGLIEAIEQKCLIKVGELRLYGSRVDDNKKGGDIDLLLIVPNKEFKQNLVKNKHQILAHIKRKIGDRKIDLLVCEAEAIEVDPFVGLIYPTSVILKKWV
jgi:predicted nucleotidyltransferase